MVTAAELNAIRGNLPLTPDDRWPQDGSGHAGDAVWWVIDTAPAWVADEVAAARIRLCPEALERLDTVLLR